MGRDELMPNPMNPVVAVPEQSWALSSEGVLAALRVDSGMGLSTREARRRFRHYGRNRLRQKPPRHSLKILFAQVASPIAGLLAVVAGLAILQGEALEAVAIAGVLLVNTLIGFWTERRAVRSMEALRRISRFDATVLRDGRPRRLPAEELVPGDIVRVEAGDLIGADLRILTASRLEVDESVLTGESLACAKDVVAAPLDAALPDRRSMLFQGTAVTRGNGEGVVVATAMTTELGRIAHLTAEARPQATPLEVRLERLGRRLLVLACAIAACIAALSIVSGRELALSLELGLALAIAAIPEGLPIVATLALARGIHQLARRHAVVDKLSAVETLGSTTLILTDKTGTLTENRMVVATLALTDGREVDFDPAAAASSPAFRVAGSSVEARDDLLLARALRIAASCNNATLLDEAGPGPLGTGDPMELALLVAARAAGITRSALMATQAEVGELAFDADTRRMATFHRDAAGIQAAVKGAPEAIIPHCRGWTDRSGIAREFDAEARANWLERAEAMAARGQRVLALAARSGVDPAQFQFEQLEFGGLVALVDPPRTDVRSAIDACQDAGIRVVMVTGDHAATAWKIASATGLIEPSHEPGRDCIDVRGFPELVHASEEDMRRILRAPVIARATPKQKLDLVRLFQDQGEIVAMTGDGVNDAPALAQADIGIAMGLRGTQVAREAAAMVLQDDEFATIVAAVGQGRAIFTHIRRFVVYLMSCNLSEIVSVALAMLLPVPPPLLPLQILFLNLVTDVFPALALAAGRGPADLMHRPPRPPDEPLVTGRQWYGVVAMGCLIAAAVVAALFVATGMLEKSGREATTIAFLTLAFAQLWHVFDMRDPGSAVVVNEITRNGWIWGALALCLVLIAGAVLSPPLARILDVTPPGVDGATLALLMSLLPVALIQLDLQRRKRRSEAKGTRGGGRSVSRAGRPGVEGR